MSVRKGKFKDHPGVLQELDLVEDSDKIMHEIALDDPIDSQDHFNIFAFDPDFEKHEEE